MKAPDYTYEPGEIMVFETGEHSDRSSHGPFRATRRFTRSEVVELFIANHKPKTKWDKPDGYDFVAWLHREGYIEDEPSTYWHVGSYGDFQP